MSVVLIEDLNNKPNHHVKKHTYWAKHGIEIARYRLPVGDYVLSNSKIMDMLARKKVRGIPPKMMDFLGTYTVCVDSKKDILELVGNICGKQHERFRDELILAKNNGIKLYILVENEGGLIKGTKDIYNPTIRNISQLHSWKNPHLFKWKNGERVYPKATKGYILQKACYTMQAKYGCEFVFCTPEESGKTIIDLLTKSM